MYMKKFTNVFCVSMLACLLAGQAYAQNSLVRAGEKAWSTNLKKILVSVPRPTIVLKTHRWTVVPNQPPFAVPGMTPQKALNLSRSISEAAQVKTSFFRKPQLTPFEQHIRHFIFTVSEAGVKNAFKGSGFVFAEQREGKTILWGLSAAHVVRHMGPNVNVTFYANGHEYTYPAEVVLTGRKYGLNAALIKLPQQVAQVALPVIAATQEPELGTSLFTFGFSAGQYKKTLRKVLFAGSERIVANFPSSNVPRPGFCGSLVLNGKGQAIGIEVGGYSPKEEGQQWYYARQHLQRLPRADLSRISEIVPISRAYDLLRSYYNPSEAPRTMLFDGIRVGQLAPNEFVESVAVRYANGHYTRLMRNPFINLWAMEGLFNMKGAAQAEIVINKNRTQTYGYLIHLDTRKVEKKGDLR